MDAESDIREHLEPIDTLQQIKECESLNSSEDEGIFISRTHNVTCGSEAEDKSDIKSTSAVNENKDVLEDLDNAHKLMIVMSDNDSDDDNIKQTLSVGRRRPAVLSEDEDSSQPITLSVNKLPISSDDESEIVTKGIKKRIVQRSYSDDSDEDTALFPKKDPSQQTPQSSKPSYKYSSDLYDAELSDEDQPPNNTEDCQSPGKSQESNDDRRADIGKKKKLVKHRPPTLKQQKEEAREIHSESQRMVRESQISLPYHKPKQRTLKEFLNRRKKVLVPQVHQGTSLKMSMRNIETLRLLEEKKKEVEEFYKSDSDQEDPDDIDWTPSNEANGQKELPSQRIALEMELDKTVDKLTGCCDDELPDITQVIDSSSSVKVLNGDSLVAEQQTFENQSPSTIDQSGNSREDPATKSMDNNNESGIHSGVSSPDSSHHGDSAATENDNAASELKTYLLNAGNKSNTSITTHEKEEDYTIINDREKDCNKIDTMPPASENLLLDSTAFVIGEAEKSDTPKLTLLASKLRDADLSKIIKGTPKLSLGREDDFIDLDEETPTRKVNPGVSELMDRFARHSSTKKKPAEKQQVNLSIVSKEKNEEGSEKLVASNVTVTLEAEEEQPAETVPGARLVSLKTTLKAKIREQREKERMRRVKEKQFLETEQVIQDHDGDGDLPDEEAELTDKSDTDYETESEPEENDIIIKDKKRKQSIYVDEEAEEDDDEDMEEADDDDDNDGPEVNEDDSNDTIEMPSTRERISVEDDDEEEDNSEQLKLHWEESQDIQTLPCANSSRVPSITRSSTEDLFSSQACKKSESMDKDASTTSMDSSFEIFGSVIPGHQPGGGMKHNRGGHPSESEGETTFLTPFTKTKSHSSSNTSRERDLSLPIEDSQDSSNVVAASNSVPPSPEGLSLHLTQLEDSQFPQHESPKINSIAKLMLDFTDIGDSQKDDLIDLCSGQFTEKTPTTQIKDLYEENLTPSQEIGELVGLCSGHFASQGMEERGKKKKNESSVSDLVSYKCNPDEDQHSDDEELLNLCTAKFTTQGSQENSMNDVGDTEKPETSLLGSTEDEELRPEPEMIIYSSDEEGANNRQAKMQARKKRKRIMQFSDDEDAQDAIEFDDEENEIPRTSFTGFKDKLKGGIRADFLENEAELSGSDVNTDDEEDDDDDNMDEEEGDLEQYDENDLRDQVGRAHLKTLLDSDKRQIRLLQEMYLEDGELHGEGRQRQFRWRNMGDDGDDNERKVLSDEEEGDDEMEDAEWRKQRFEREKFLQEQRAKVDENETEIPVFKMSRRPIVRSTSLVTDSSAKREPLKAANPLPVLAAPLPSFSTPANNPFLFQSKRGSFLSRDKNTLARIAELTKDKGSVVGGAKQAGNFVFQQLSAEEVQEKEESTKTKKPNSLPISKKLKLDRTFCSMDESSQSTSIFKYF
ncbi:hypothetical protein OTU49_003648 [Cherax quadricarinatus]|uniref:Claspin n=1 Tax=Cherax quadricarinatus TaxID=27406 RepID=A0AAW0X2W5_CHEQU|nr:claspin-like [Cherax quadricarinatus]